jgi:hypothetical protein
MKIKMAIFVVCVLAAFPSARAPAAEQAFECPRISPIDGQTPLAFVKVLHDGGATWGYPDADVTRKENGATYQMNNHEASNFTKARLECIYANNRRPPLHSTFLDMPGLLLRCESLQPDLPLVWDRSYGRSWCTTRTENPVQR